MPPTTAKTYVPTRLACNTTPPQDVVCSRVAATPPLRNVLINWAK
jgi:hypothetical protein